MSQQIELSRAQVLGYRAAVQHLEHPAGDPLADGVLLAGVQDSPPGRTADVALRVRGADPDPAAVVRVHSLRAAPHLHRSNDVGLLSAVLGTLRVADLAKQTFGPFGQQLDDDGISFDWALNHVADAMRRVSAQRDGSAKGELSSAINDLVDPRLRPWCQRCGAHHVQDALFRYATLRAGLAIAPRKGGSDRGFDRGFDYVPLATWRSADPESGTATLVRRFLRLCGPCEPEHLARWLALTPAAARRLWKKVADQLVGVTVEGRRGWLHQEDLSEVRAADAATGVRLLPPYDPLTELADRELVLPDAAQRRAVWRPVGSPGVLLVRGEIAGTYRQRRSGRRLTITVEPFGELTATDRRAAGEAAEQLAAGDAVEVTVA